MRFYVKWNFIFVAHACACIEQDVTRNEMLITLEIIDQEKQRSYYDVSF